MNSNVTTTVGTKDLVQVKNLKKFFPIRGGVFQKRACLGAGCG